MELPLENVAVNGDVPIQNGPVALNSKLVLVWHDDCAGGGDTAPPSPPPPPPQAPMNADNSSPPKTR